MPKNPTIAANNVFCIARKQAASFNDNLNSREGASEELGIDRTRLARIELGSLNPYPEEVLMMSDVYNAPDRLTIKILSALNDADYIPQTLIKVVEDGIITEEEKPEIEKILASLQKISEAATETRIWIEKHM